MTMKRWIGVVLLTFVSLAPLQAQQIEQFKARLDQEIASEANGKMARVEVVEHGTAAEVVARQATVDPEARLRGYRVCIFFDNGQDARAGAMAAKQTFEEHFPDIKLYMVYENPYFRVTVGNCLTIEEAVILKGRLASLFPKAFPKSEELLLQDLLE